MYLFSVYVCVFVCVATLGGGVHLKTLRQMSKLSRVISLKVDISLPTSLNVLGT